MRKKEKKTLQHKMAFAVLWNFVHLRYFGVFFVWNVDNSFLLLLNVFWCRPVPPLILASLRCKFRVWQFPRLSGGQVAHFIILLSCCPLLAWEEGSLQGCCVAMYNSCWNSCMSGHKRRTMQMERGRWSEVDFVVSTSTLCHTVRHAYVNICTDSKNKMQHCIKRLE